MVVLSRKREIQNLCAVILFCVQISIERKTKIARPFLNGLASFKNSSDNAFTGTLYGSGFVFMTQSNPEVYSLFSKHGSRPPESLKITFNTSLVGKGARTPGSGARAKKAADIRVQPQVSTCTTRISAYLTTLYAWQ